jgi:hypothetical protein
MRKALALLAVSSACLFCGSAGAVVITPTIQDLSEPGAQVPVGTWSIETFNSVTPIPTTATGSDSFAQFTASASPGHQLPQIVQGSLSGQYAAPFFGVGQPNTFKNGQDSTPYLTVYGGGSEDIKLLGNNQTVAFGLYIGSLDAYNHIAFYENGTLINTPDINGTYIANNTVPNNPPKSTQLNNQLNFNSSGYFIFSGMGAFNEVVLSSTQNSFEVDNVAFFNPTTAQGPVPEASTWVMMILGFLSVGLVGYRRTGLSLRLV